MAQTRQTEAHASASLDTPSRSTSGTSWRAPAALGRAAIAGLCGIALLFNLPLLHYYLLRGPQPTTASVPYANDFADPGTVERDFWSTGGLWRVEDGRLLSPGVRNNPLWLKASLPPDVAVEFDATSMSPQGDIKVEIFGDGVDHASGYVLIHGGWNNTISVIARLDEHGVPLRSLQFEAQQRAQTGASKSADLIDANVYRADTRVRVEANPFPVKAGQTYRWRIARKGSLITWSIDGTEFMRFDDPIPLRGPRNDRLGFSSWESQLYFDNLVITPL